MGQATNLSVGRLFTQPKKKAYDQLKWVKVDSVINNPISGKNVFEQKDVEFPKEWSQNAINIVAQKYFSGNLGTKERESSLKTLIDRVVDTVTRQGVQEGYFDNETEAEDYCEELKYILVTQKASFNSPVWFNVGVKSRAQQASACFILGIEDNMPAILNWYVEEGMIFKGGSDSGINLSVIRSSGEPLSDSAGTASGPLSFMRGADASAGAIKSGGKTLRADKIVILNANHPDVEEFIWSKALEERKARDLEAAGWDITSDGKDSFSLQYQNATISVRVTDEFMEAVVNGDDWDMKTVTSGRTIKTVKARDLFRQIAQAAWECADPGIQFDTTINQWNTTPVAGRIDASNPGSEYMHLNDSACNLASINLLQYLRNDNTFDIQAFEHTVDVMFTAQEILVGYSQYPTEKIAKNAKAYRELGLGYANLGALLMAQGLPYDSDEGRAQAAAITALMTGRAYAVSAKLAAKVGPFAGFNNDREGVIKVLKMHREEISKIDAGLVSEELLSAAAAAWDEAVELGEIYGIRNSQASLLAPTGTIGLMMDCDTTGIEPNLGLLRIKKLAGEDASVVNQTVLRALKVLGYDQPQIDEIVGYIDVEKTILGAPYLSKEHESVFACSMGESPIHYLGHVKMMAAVQPFLSGSISKIVNIPEEATVEDIEQLHIDSWKMGLKTISIYRDNCRVVPAPRTSNREDTKQEESISLADSINDKIVLRGAVRRELPKVRNSKTFSFKVSDSHGYITVGEFEDGTPGEIFMRIAKQGSTLAGFMDALAISLSHGLQYGVPLKAYVKSMTSMSFAPSGMTDDPDIRTASSLVDYIFRRLALSYLSFDDRLELGLASIEDMPEEQTSLLSTSELEIDAKIFTEVEALPISGEIPTEEPNVAVEPPKPKPVVQDSAAPLCYNCGNQTQRAGSCYVCSSCGSTTGCS